ncbi:hypothetical protein [Nocardia carnea]|uniref:hypothetical protein n=1 Tax=Nocardia carnea TaxID=37328 RepID=UPI002453CF0E|nr:hypothetical protein [Nocardia carnea]
MAAEPRAGRRWWTPIGAGAVLCLACCLTPLLLAAGTLGGGAPLVSLSWIEPLGVGLLLVLGIAGLIWSRTRARRSGCAGDDRTGGTCVNSGCGCAAATS